MNYPIGIEDVDRLRAEMAGVRERFGQQWVITDWPCQFDDSRCCMRDPAGFRPGECFVSTMKEVLAECAKGDEP